MSPKRFQFSFNEVLSQTKESHLLNQQFFLYNTCKDWLIIRHVCKYIVVSYVCQWYLKYEAKRHNVWLYLQYVEICSFLNAIIIIIIIVKNKQKETWAYSKCKTEIKESWIITIELHILRILLTSVKISHFPFLVSHTLFPIPSFSNILLMANGRRLLLEPNRIPGLSVKFSLKTQNFKKRFSLTNLNTIGLSWSCRLLSILDGQVTWSDSCKDEEAKGCSFLSRFILR